MNKYIEIMAVVEGKTEQDFVNKILSNYLANKGIYIRATQISKPGQKGGDVKFSRVKRDVLHFLKQREDTFVTTFVDYYGMKEWPELDSISSNMTSIEISDVLKKASIMELKTINDSLNIDSRFIPYIALHEFEALLFSDADILSEKMGIDISEIKNVLEEAGSPEEINNSPETSPSKRLDKWTNGGKFRKTTKGIDIAEKIGIEKMRSECLLFDKWLNEIENI